jgi:uncharacterized membrane protein YgaE (UPF0421/DUF939 family)
MLVITIGTFCKFGRTIGLVYSIYDSTDEAIKKMMIEASQKMIKEQNNSPPVNEHFKLQIKTLQNAPRDPERLLKIKERQKEEEAMYMEDTHKGWLHRN